MSLPPNEFSIIWAATVVSACAFWGIVATNILIAFCNPRWFASVLDRTIHRACAAHEALVAAIAAHEAYRARNAAEWPVKEIPHA